MRLALVTYFCPPYRRNLLVEMSQRYDLTTIFTSRGNEWYELGDRPTQIEGLRTLSIPSAAGLSRELTAGGYDAIITSLSGRATLLATFGAAKFKHLPLVLWVEIWEHPRTLVHSLSRPVTHQLYRWADAIVAFGPHVADFVNGECGGRRGVFIATQAVDNQRFRAPIDPQRVTALRSRLELGDCPTVTFVGRLVPEKGVADLLAASAQVDLPHRVVIAGRGPMFGSLSDQAAFLGISDRVRFIGHIAEPDLLDLLHASSLLVLPSRISKRWREPWGMVTNEAMNLWRPHYRHGRGRRRGRRTGGSRGNRIGDTTTRSARAGRRYPGADRG